MTFRWERFLKSNSLEGVHGLLVESTILLAGEEGGRRCGSPGALAITQRAAWEAKGTQLWWI